MYFLEAKFDSSNLNMILINKFHWSNCVFLKPNLKGASGLEEFLSFLTLNIIDLLCLLIAQAFVLKPRFWLPFLDLI